MGRLRERRAVVSLDDPPDVAEDLRLRSLYVRKLIQEGPSEPQCVGRVDIPKVIVQFWHDSCAIPSDVRECLESWEVLTTRGFTHILFDEKKARLFISRRFGPPEVAAFDRCHHPAMRSDYFRLCYILMNGGLYVDADDFYQGADCDSLFRDDRLKVQPFCFDPDGKRMVGADIFLRGGARSAGWIFYINNNPLIAPPSHPIIRLALDRSTRILLSHCTENLEVQSTTGPGNLTASLVRHSIASERAGAPRDFTLLTDWESIAATRWSLSYRNDERNWRLWWMLVNSPGAARSSSADSSSEGRPVERTGLEARL